MAGVTAYSNLETKLEAAAKVVLDTGATGYTARTGLDDANKTLPAVLLHAEKGAETPLNSGNYRLKLTVSVMDNADTVTLATHRTGAARVFDLFLVSELPQTLSDGTPDFTIFMVTGRDGSATRVEDRQWISEISLDLYGCASAIT